MNLSNRDIFFIVLTSALLLTSLSLWVIIDWEEVEEYDEMYSPMDCCSCPAPPYTYEQMFMYVFLIFSFVSVATWFIGKYGGRE